MSLAANWPEISAALQCDDGAPATWRALFGNRARSLLVAADGGTKARDAVNFFCGTWPLRLSGELTLHSQRWFGYPQPVMVGQIHAALPQQLGLETTDLSGTALQCGSSGPLQKLVLFAPSSANHEARTVKIALRPTADIAIEREVAWLDRLVGHSGMAGRVPRLVKHGKLPSGRSFVTATAVETGVRLDGFSPPVADFLHTLHVCDETIRPWSEHSDVRDMESALDACRHYFPPAAGKAMNAAWQSLHLSLGMVKLPSVVQHGDFAPWNMKMHDDQLCVFDWEYAKYSSNMLADYLHFHLVPRALGWRKPSIGYLTSTLMPAAEKFVRQSSTLGKTAVSVIPSLVLAYLVDTVVFYVQTTQLFDPQDAVVNAYMPLIAARSRWMP